jgi:hypothetical protein
MTGARKDLVLFMEYFIPLVCISILAQENFAEFLRIFIKIKKNFGQFSY